MLPTLHIQLLGDFCLTYGNEPVTRVNTERLQSLLAYLVLHRNVPQPRQRIAFCFWPDSAEAQARTNLRRELHHLRQALPDADCFIQSDTKTLQWRPDAPFILDVAQFEELITQAEIAERNADLTAVRIALEKAAELYQGDLLLSCYDEWIIPEREQLKQTCIRALEWLVHLLEGKQEYPAAIRYAQQLLRVDPLREATYCCLIQLYALSGDRANAVRVYQQCQEVLQRELDVEPSPVTDQTYKQLLERHQPLSSPAVESSRVAPIFSVQSQLSSSSQRLVGREREWSTINQWITNPEKAGSEILLLVGEPGIGKTRLLEEIATTIHSSNGCVLWGRGFAAEMVRPYGVWIDAFRAIAASQGASLPTELGSLLPEIGSTTSPADRTQLFDAVVQFLSQLSAEGITVVILDDIQWLDEASTALLHYTARLLEPSSVLWACAARQQELEENGAVFKWVQALRREQRLRKIALSPLNQEQTAELIRSLDMEIDDQRVFADSGGNPLFALEVARALSQHETGHSDDLQALIQARLWQLENTTRELVSWAAALGRSFSSTIVARIADCSLTQLLTGLDQLERHGIIRPSTSVKGEVGYDFAHDVVRQVAYHQLSEPRRQLVHLHIAHALEKLAGADEALVGDVAHHASLSGDHSLAASASLAAAQRCLRLFAYAEASELAQRGMHHCQYLDDRCRVRLHLELLKVYVIAGVTKERVPQLEETLHQLIAEASRLNLKDEEATGLEGLIVLNYDHGNLTGVYQNSLRAAETGRAASPTTTARMLAYTGSCLAEIEREMPRAEALLLEAQSLAERVGMELCDIPLGLGCVRRYTAEFDEAHQLLVRGWQIAQTEQDHWRVCSCLCNLAMLELETGNPTAALIHCSEMATVAVKMSGEGSEGPFAAALSALADYALGQDGAKDILEQALLTLRQIDAKRMLAYVLTFAAEIDVKYDRIELALSRAEAALKAAKIINYPSEVVLAWAMVVHATLALDKCSEAMKHFQALQQHLGEWPLSVRARTAVNRLIQEFKDSEKSDFYCWSLD